MTYRPRRIKSIDLSRTTKEDANLESYDFSRLTAVATCPTYGIVRYGHHRTLLSDKRMIPLESGAAMHEAFAAVRLVELYHQDAGRVEAVGLRLYGKERWEKIKHLVLESREDLRMTKIRFALEVLGTSGFFDDPLDKRRTLTRMEESLLTYITHTSTMMMPLFISDDIVGIEVPFDITVRIVMEDDEEQKFRYVGRIDGLHLDQHGIVTPVENKTASRLDQVWETGMSMSHQLTGYVIAARTLFDARAYRSVVFGLSVPMPAYGGNMAPFTRIIVDKLPAVEAWGNWMRHVIELDRQYRSQPFDAPRYTHSCNRYFRACPFIELCGSRDEGEFTEFMEAMDVSEWNPLAENR